MGDSMNRINRIGRRTLIAMAFLAIVAAAISLTGCSYFEEQRVADFQAIERGDDAQCRSYGAVPGSPAYINCRTLVANQRSAAEAQKDAVVGAYLLNRR